MYTAELKRPLRESAASKRAAVDALIRDLNLVDCRATRIGNSLQPGILGGQVSPCPSPGTVPGLPNTSRGADAGSDIPVHIC